MGDLSEAQALQYLEKRGIAAKAAAQVVDVTGGRLLQLMSAVEVLQRGGTTEGAQIMHPNRCNNPEYPASEHSISMSSLSAFHPPSQGSLMLRPARLLSAAPKEHAVESSADTSKIHQLPVQMSGGLRLWLQRQSSRRWVCWMTRRRVLLASEWSRLCCRQTALTLTSGTAWFHPQR